jgi:hypothetical protein
MDRPRYGVNHVVVGDRPRPAAHNTTQMTSDAKP